MTVSLWKAKYQVLQFKCAHILIINIHKSHVSIIIPDHGYACGG